MDFYKMINQILEKCSIVIREEKEKLVKKEELDSITYGQFQIIDHIATLNNPTITLLADKLNMTKPSMTVHIQKMERSGLVYKEKSIEDGRVYYIRLTDKGRRVEMAEHNAFKRLESAIQDKLTEEQKLQFTEIIHELLS